ncbi:MAG TPA: GNVR domain-containing protein [Terracidiphilus sp.]|jgi:tyrosine-protein kinase Etk/Wzc
MKTEIPISDLNEAVDSPAVLVSGRVSGRVSGLSAKENDDISLLDLLIILGEGKGIIFAVTAGFIIFAIILSLIMPKSYTASVMLLPPQESNSIGSALNSQLGGMAALLGSGLGLKNTNDTYIAMFKSEAVEDGMVEHFGLMQQYHVKFLSDARKIFESHTTLDGSGKDGMIHIAIVDKDPNRAAQLANGYVDQFRLLSENIAITEASQRRLFFQKELEKTKDQLANAEEALKLTESTTGVMQVDMQARALTESASSLRGQITAKEVQIQGMETYATGENSQLVQAESELASLRAQLAKVGGSEDSPGSELIIPKGKVPQAGLEFIRKQRDVKYYETIFDILARQFEAAKLDEAKEGAIIQVVAPATVPDRRSSPKRAIIVIVATLVGVFFGVLFALLRGALQYAKQDPETNIKLEHLRRALFRRRQTAH